MARDPTGCARCSGLIESPRAGQKYCSHLCKVQAGRAATREKRAASYPARCCGWCGASLLRRSQQARFCNDQCRYAKRYAINRDVKIARVMRRLATPEGAALASERRHRKRAIRRQATVLPITAGQLTARLSMFPGCWVCGQAATTVDHVKPLSRGGPHMLANLRPACLSCNSRKSATWHGVAYALEQRAMLAATAYLVMAS